MPSISHLIEYPDPVAPSAQRGAVLDRFLDHPALDLIAVVDAGRPVGIIARGAVSARDPRRPVEELMSPALTIGADADVEEACALVLAHSEPVAGLVVVGAAGYQGVVGARALMRLKCEAQPVADDNRRFVEMISSELRAPMGGVLALADMLQRQPLSADAQSFVRTIVESCQVMSTALDHALELSRADMGDLVLDPRPVRLREVMDEVQSRWQTRTEQERVNLAVAYDGEPDLMAEIDAARLKQLFDGLIGAALAGSRRGAIEASLRAERSVEGLRLIGRVRDSGGGLSAARLNRSFAGGAHGDLGLAFCHRLIARLGGDIRAEANVGAGATIVFDFPAREAILDVEPAGGAGQTTNRAAHVLVVDDNATNRMVAEALCEMFDCTSECVEDGLEALEAARTGRFDLILMDIRMPRMDGVEATRAIRALPGSAGAVPIIALTANADVEDAKSYIACGMNSVVEKPIKPERLLQAMNAALSDTSSRAAAA